METQFIFFKAEKRNGKTAQQRLEPNHTNKIPQEEFATQRWAQTLRCVAFDLAWCTQQSKQCFEFLAPWAWSTSRKFHSETVSQTTLGARKFRAQRKHLQRTFGQLGHRLGWRCCGKSGILGKENLNECSKLLQEEKKRSTQHTHNRKNKVILQTSYCSTTVFTASISSASFKAMVPSGYRLPMRGYNFARSEVPGPLSPVTPNEFNVMLMVLRSASNWNKKI
jgi:hypothetical protein